MAKQAVRFSKKQRTNYRFQKLKLCKKCYRYSVLQEEHCPACGTALTGIEILVKTMVKNRFLTEAIRILLVVCLGVILAPTMTAMYYSLIAGLLFCCSYMILATTFLKSEYFHQLKKLLRKDLRRIAAGIQVDSDLANDDAKEGNLVQAYEKLRDISCLISSSQMKIRQVRVLNEMALRSDMELELEGLIPSSYDRDFVKYALEVLKINRTLISKKCIAYFAHYRDAVAVDFGRESLVSVAGTALRMKLYILEFAPFIEEYLDYFPKERLLRLCSILQADPKAEWGSLWDKAQRLIAMKYAYDPNFKRFAATEGIKSHV